MATDLGLLRPRLACPALLFRRKVWKGGRAMLGTHGGADRQDCDLLLPRASGGREPRGFCPLVPCLLSSSWQRVLLPRAISVGCTTCCRGCVPPVSLVRVCLILSAAATCDLHQPGLTSPAWRGWWMRQCGYRESTCAWSTINPPSYSNREVLSWQSCWFCLASSPRTLAPAASQARCRRESALHVGADESDTHLEGMFAHQLCATGP